MKLYGGIIVKDIASSNGWSLLNRQRKCALHCPPDNLLCGGAGSENSIQCPLSKPSLIIKV